LPLYDSPLFVRI
jgi:hypothetical protein